MREGRLFVLLGRLAVRRPKTIVAVWVVLLGLLAVPAAGLSEKFLYDEGASSKPTESRLASDLLAQEFPRRSSASSALVVVGADRPFDDDPAAAAAARAVARAIQEGGIPDALSASDPWIATVRDGEDPYARSWAEVRATAPPGALAPFVNDAGDTMVYTVALAHRPGDRDAQGEFYASVATSAIRSAIASTSPQAAGLRVFTTGDAGLAADQRAAAHAPWEFFVTVTLALILIGVFFRSLAAPFLPIGMLGLATGLTQGILFFAAGIWGGIQYNAYSLLTSVLLGAGADYAIFMVARYREERRAGLLRDDAVVATVRTAGASITTSGFAVIVSFGSLGLGSFQIVQQMGVAVAIGIFVVLALGLTLLPAILRLAGDRVFWPARRAVAPTTLGPDAGYFVRSARWAVRQKWVVMGIALAATLPAIVVLATTPVSFDFLEGAPESEARDGFDVLRASFGEGSLLPTVAAVSLSVPLISPTGAIDEDAWRGLEALSASLADDPAVSNVAGPTRPGGVPLDPAGFAALAPADREAALSPVRSFLGASERTALVRITLASTPYSDAALDSVTTLRARAHDAVAAHPEIGGVLLGGATVALSETRESIVRDTMVMLSVVFGSMFLVLFVALRSIVVPIRAIVTILLSISWALALTVALFQGALGFGIIWIAPLVTFVMLFGLGMDYDIFLVTAVREGIDAGESDVDAIVGGMRRTGGVITLAGLVMGGAFYGLALNDNLLLRQMGFALGTGVLIDALLVRTYLVPAILVVGAKWNWWLPRGLRRFARRPPSGRAMGR